MTEGGAFGCIPDLGTSHSNRAVSTLHYPSLPFTILRAPSCPFVDILPTDRSWSVSSGCNPDLGTSHSNRAFSTLLYLSLPFVPLRAPSWISSQQTRVGLYPAGATRIWVHPTVIGPSLPFSALLYPSTPFVPLRAPSWISSQQTRVGLYPAGATRIWGHPTVIGPSLPFSILHHPSCPFVPLRGYPPNRPKLVCIQRVQPGFGAIPQ